MNKPHDTSAARYSGDERRELLDVAFHAVERGVRHGMPAAVPLSAYRDRLRIPRATFVTLKHNQRLRGCIGSLEAVRPLVEDVNANAFAAALRDPRFPPVDEGELAGLAINISVLSDPAPVAAASEQHLLDRLRPGIDGLILQLGNRRGTFLPAVWESLPKPRDFLRQLKLKSGLAEDYWSADLKVWRYSVESITEWE